MDQNEPHLDQNETGPQREVIELEVERIDDPADDLHRGPLHKLRGRLLGSLLPVGLGLGLDALDFATRSPRVGLVLGVLAGLFLAGRLRLVGGRRIMLICACAAYCASPITTYLPLAGLYALFNAAQPFVAKTQGRAGS